MDKLTRVKIAQETLEIFKNGYYEKKGEKVEVADSLKYAIDNTIHYQPNDFDGIKLPTHSFETKFEVYNETTFSATRRLIVKNGIADVICLNFASAKNPGGGFLNGSQAQEESLARASGMYMCQITQPRMYESNKKFTSCLYTDHMIYSRSVPVIRDDADELLNTPYLVSILTAPAVNVGCLKQHQDEEGLSLVDEYMLRRTKRVLQVCAHQGHKNLVLGAWGCGVFQNDPNKVANYFAQHLEGEFKGQFERIIFAVLDVKENGTFAAFKTAFASSN